MFMAVVGVEVREATVWVKGGSIVGADESCVGKRQVDSVTGEMYPMHHHAAQACRARM